MRPWGAGEASRLGEGAASARPGPGAGPATAPRGWRDRAAFLALDAVLGVEELAGFTLSNRPVRDDPASGGHVAVVLVADRFPVPGDPLAEYAASLAAARVEAAARPERADPTWLVPVVYREDDGTAARWRALVRLSLRHPWRVLGDRRGRSRVRRRRGAAPAWCSRRPCCGWPPIPTRAYRRSAVRRLAPSPGGWPRWPAAPWRREGELRVQLVDPPAYTPPYDHALAAALARAGAQVELVTSRFAYGDVPAADGYAVSERFYRSALGAPASRLRRATKLAVHVPDMLAYRRAARAADVVHFQWLTVPWLDGRLLPDRPLVLTAHDLLPREPRPGQVAAQRRLLARMDAVVVHSRYGASQLVERAGVAAEKVNVIPHGAFDGLARVTPAPLPDELAAVSGPVVLFFGLLRPYKGLDVLLQAWRGITGASLWIVGRPRMDIAPLRAAAGPGRAVRAALRSRRRAGRAVSPRRRGRAALRADRAL